MLNLLHDKRTRLKLISIVASCTLVNLCFSHVMAKAENVKTDIEAEVISSESNNYPVDDNHKTVLDESSTATASKSTEGELIHNENDSTSKTANKKNQTDSAPAAMVTEENNESYIEYELPENEEVKFSERRKWYSIVFGANYSPIETKKFRSNYDGFTYSELYGSSPMPYMQISVGPKFNTSFASMSFEGIFGQGFIEDTRVDEKRSLTLMKKGIVGTIYLDGIFKEPYVVPYGSFEAYELDYTDKAPDETRKGTTDITTGYSFGMLLQLNWLDPHPAEYARRNYGLHNTYVDLFLTAQNTSQSKDDPDFQTSISWGAGLKLEF